MMSMMSMMMVMRLAKMETGEEMDTGGGGRGGGLEMGGVGLSEAILVRSAQGWREVSG